MRLSKEQEFIVNSEDEKIIVDAKAGSGKTTTLVEFTKKRPLSSFLYIAYNSAIRKSSIKKFGPNTVVHTAHSLAFEKIGFLYKTKLTSNLSIKNIINSLDDLHKLKQEVEQNHNIYLKAFAVQDMLQKYFNLVIDDLNKIEDKEIKKLSIEYWDKMQDLRNENAPMTHDGYLRLFRDSKIPLNYDYIIVDESQDLNEATIDIILSQGQGAKKVFVGDKHQEIYGFKMVTNIFNDDRFKDYKKYYLTNSFRFAESVAFVANSIIGKYKKEENLVIGASVAPDQIVYDMSKEDRYTIITRTNAHLFDKAVTLVEEGKKVSIIGDYISMFSELYDCYYLYMGDFYKIKNQQYKEYGSFSNMKDIAKKVKDLDLLFAIKVIEKYAHTILEKTEMLKRKLISKNAFGNIILTTAHKSKGLEFDNVVIENDFYDLRFKDGNLRPVAAIPYEEINLYYVAVTRAAEKIQLNDSLCKIV